MNIIIHRGAKETGHSCVEVRSLNNRILVDFGIPLVIGDFQFFDSKQLEEKSIQELRAQGVLPDINGLYKDGQKSIDAILISHSYPGHYGFLRYVNPEIPIYLSQGASLLIEAFNSFISTKVPRLNMRIIKPKKQFSIGGFTIAPFAVDPCAFDALAFLIEAEGKRLFYSGDFRAHRRKAELFKQLVEKPPQNIDCLLMDGAAFDREDAEYKTEVEVEKRLEEILNQRKNMTFLFVSSQNIERIVSAYKACLNTGSIFVIDIYTAFVLDKLRKVFKRIPQFNWKNLRIKFQKNQAEALAAAGYRDLLYVYNKRKIDVFEISRNKQRILMLASDNSVFPVILKDIKDVAGATIAYSMWEGYLSEQFGVFCGEKGLILEYIHTSGYPNPEDLQAFASAIKPKTLASIHTFDAQKYPLLFNNVKILSNGEAFDI